MAVALLLVFVSMFLPVLIGTGVTAMTYDQWADGCFVRLGAELPGGGQWLSCWLLLASAATNVGMFEAEMSSDAWQVAG